MRRWIVSLAVAAVSFAADTPRLSPEAIVSAADHRGGRVSPGEIIVLYPENAGPEQLLGAQLDSNGRVATELADTQVYFDGIPAPLAYTVRGEVGAVVPYEVAGHATTEVVVEYQGRKSAPVTIPVVASNPALFTQNRVGTGQAGILLETGCCNSPENPAVRGVITTVYATGEGLLHGHIPTGSVSAYNAIAAYPKPTLPVKLTIGGVPAELDYAAAAPHAIAGLLQINFFVPKNAPIGDAIPIVLTVGDASSSELATMAVRDKKDQVLIAESDPAAREYLAEILTKAGYEVYTASYGADAVEQARSHPFDLIVIGLNAPETDRAEWIRAMRAARSRLKIAATVPDTSPDSLRAADMIGAQTIITKPLRSADVTARIRELIRRRGVVYEAGKSWPFPDR